MKILVIGPSWVGDMMMSQSLYRTIKQRHPAADIEVMAPPWCKPLLQRMAEVSRALTMPVGHGELALVARYRIGRHLRSQGYSQALVLPNSWKSALIPFFAGIGKRTGWRGEMRYGLLNDLRKLNKARWPLMVQRYVALGYDSPLHSAHELPAPLLRPQLRVTPQEALATRNAFALNPQRPVIGFCPGAEFGPAKRWPHYHYASLAGELIDNGYQILIAGSDKDRSTGEQIRQGLTAPQQDYCHNLAGRTCLDQALVLLFACQGVVSNDSGLMHVAAALDRPLVALYGPSSPEFTPPLSDKARVIRLISGYHKIRRGTGDEGYHQSLIDISPARVMQQLLPLLSAEERE